MRRRMDILGSDAAILALTTVGLVVTTVSILLDTREQRERAAAEKVRAGV